MAVPVDSSPPWDERVPGSVDDGFGWTFDVDPPGAPELPPEWDEDLDGPLEFLGFLDDLDVAHGLDEGLLDDPADVGQWAVPGLPGTGDGESGLSRASVAALAETTASWEALRRAEARCYRSLTALAACDAVGESGYRSTARLLTDHVRIDPAEGLRLARHARALTGSVSPTGAPLPAALPATAVQVSAGVIGPGHVEVIRTTMNRLAAVAGVDPDTLAVTETELAQLATTRSPAALAEAAAAILALLDADGAAPDDQPAPENELHYLRRRNGTLIGKFTYRDPAAAETLHTALSVATPPAEATPAPADDEPRGESFGVQAARTLPERRAQALLELAGEALTRGLDIDDEPDNDHPDNDDPDQDKDEDPADEDEDAGPAAGEPPAWTRADLEGGERVAVTVTLNYDTLRRALAEHPATGPTPGLSPELALLGENTYIRAETARRMACDAEIIPALLGTRGEILDIGRKTRTIPRSLRRAVILRDRHCAHPGCRRRARRCQVHHICHWADHGDTCLENCVLLCSYHHTLIHHSGWEVHMIDGLPWFTPPAWLDPLRRPRHNRPWHDQQTA